MRFEASQQFRMSQQMKLAPRMIQSMEILQLPLNALEERIEQELESNIALERVETAPEEVEAPTAPSESRETSDSEGFSRLDELERNYAEDFEERHSLSESFRLRRQAEEGLGSKMEAMANTAAREEGLTDQLIHQWDLAEVPEDVRAAGHHLINYIDADGYIRTDLATIIDQAPHGLGGEAIEAALEPLQRWLEPAGIGARDLRECLLLQIDALEEEDPQRDFAVARRLIEHHLADIEANRLPKICEQTGLSMEELKAGLESLRGLNPRPGRRLVSESAAVIIPDAAVEYDDTTDEYTVTLRGERIPRLRINAEYEKMALDRNVDKSTREFIDGNVSQARWLIGAIEQRNNTLLRVLRAVVAHQREFFEQGPQALKPLPMTLVADQLGVHVATVSRAVNGKWVETPRGVLPLRKFFSAGTETESGDDMSWEAVRDLLREIIEAEDRSNPLGDDKLAAELEKRGVKIARRTVAKYRDQLNIPPARLRKQF